MQPLPFPVDRPNLLLCIRTFLDLLFERVKLRESSTDIELPGGFSFDGVALALIRHGEIIDMGVQLAGLADGGNDKHADILGLLEELVGRPPRAAGKKGRS